MSSFKPGIVSRSAASALNAAADRISGLSQSGMGAGEPRVGGVDGKYLHIPGTELTSDWWFAELTNAGSGSPPAHTWQEVVETAGGTWAVGDRSGGGAYQLAASGGSSAAAASGSLVLMRRSPTVDGLYEFAVVVGGASLNTRNTPSGTESGTTTDLRMKEATGIYKDKDGVSAGIDTLELLAASTSQMGAITTGNQTLAGNKATTGSFISSAAGTAFTAPYSYITYDANGAAVYAIATSATAAMLSITSGTLRTAQSYLTGGSLASCGSYAQHSGTATRGAAHSTWSNGVKLDAINLDPLVVGVNAGNTERGISFAENNPPTSSVDATFDIYIDTAEWSSGTPNTGVVRCRQDFIAGDCKRFGVRRQPSGGGSYQDVDGVDHDFDVGQFPVVRGGIIVGYRTATGGSYGTIGSTATYPSITCSLLVAVAGGE